jgi:hypothetical protein
MYIRKKCLVLIIYIIYNNNHGSTALYGLRPPLSEVTWSAQFGADSILM